ncbi:MAG TPA: Na+/H+ antiporter NhaA [Hyphomicrobiaceae bacterium]|nr:Na+/H+ antiporter NhaA [Hyphomicrobiaceae bacterium]
MKKQTGALEFIHHEAASGVMLLGAALLALVLANSPLAFLYDGLLDTPVSVRIGALVLDKHLLHWINDGLMAVFFFHVGLEIKRELLAGELSTPRQAALPLAGAAGGMAVPALMYIAINWGDAHALDGWAIPTATDIAFAVAVLALAGPRIPPALKVFLLALAIIDDLGAILIIAFFYTPKLSLEALALAAIGIGVLAMLNRRGVSRIAPYVLAGLFVWVCVLKSGVHATLAGVVTAFAIPLEARETHGSRQASSLAGQLQENLHPWVNFGVLPLFAFANAGVSLAGVTLAKLLSPIPLGIALGLFIGKPVGVFSFTFAAIKLGLGTRPEGASWMQLFGAAILAGVGFTMSLFIGMLAFPEPAHAAAIRIGVLAGSLISAVAGFVLLRSAPLNRS